MSQIEENIGLWIQINKVQILASSLASGDLSKSHENIHVPVASLTVVGSPRLPCIASILKIDIICLGHCWAPASPAQ